MGNHGRRVAAAAAAVIWAGGCADREGASAYISSKPAPAAATSGAGAGTAELPLPPGFADPQNKKPAAGTPGKSSSASAHPVTPPNDSVKEQVALVAFGRDLAPILRERDAAQSLFEADVRKAGAEIEKKGFAALLPPYEKYDRAIERALKKVDRLKPPTAAKGVEEAILSSLHRLDANLDSTVAAMHTDNGEEAAALNKERRDDEKAGAQGIADALEAGGFDVLEFARNTAFVRRA